MNNKLKIPYPGRPRKEEKQLVPDGHREYYRKNFTLAFETLDELDMFNNKVLNMKRKLGLDRNDQIFMMAWKLLEDKVYGMKNN